MAPKRKTKSGEGEVTAPKRKTKSSALPPEVSPRKTRSATAGKRVDPPAAPPVKKAKVSTNVDAKKAAAKRKADDDAVAKDNASDAAGEAPGAPPPDSSKTIIVEACKQCNSFKTRAMKVKEDLEKAVPGIIVTINPDKPRRGCFEIREESGQLFISLLNMPRPFTPMKKLDMDEVIEDIIKKIT